MWLLNVKTRKLKAFEGRNIPLYAILSHRWEGEEVSFQDVQNGQAEHKGGYHKLDMFCKQVIQDRSYLRWVWMDTCCIDKSNNSELSEAINSMYRWYEKANLCYAYLSDVSHEDGSSFRNSVWFTRGWTLQELLAPSLIEFFDAEWNSLGTKDTLVQEISDITNIALGALTYTNPFEFSVADRMSWAANRQTTREEDMAYSLLGIFDVNMPLIYGEGKRAFHRLQEEILRVSEDLTIFAWRGYGRLDMEVLADSPRSFHRDGGDYPWTTYISQRGTKGFTALGSHGTTITNAGITINMTLIPYFLDTYLVPVYESDLIRCICVTRDPKSGYFRKALIDGKHLSTVSQTAYTKRELRRLILGRGSMISMGLTSEESYYKFEIEHITPEALEALECFSDLLPDGSPVSSRVELLSRFDSAEDPTSLILRAGTSGIAGMVRFACSHTAWVFLLFGHDFDFNPFCLVARASLTEFDNRKDVTTNFTDSIKGKHRFLLESEKDMMELTTAMQHESRQSWSLQEEGAEFHQASWTDSSVWNFSVAELIRVVVKRRMGANNYSITIDSLPVVNLIDVVPRKTEKWHLQQWTG